MRPLRYSINVTLDGCCDHRAIIPDEDLHRHAVENLNRADALLFGRVTYEMMEAAWRQPERAGARPEWMEPCARTIDAAKKYVVSSTLDRVDWNAELVRGDLQKAVQQLKRESGKGLFVAGVKLPQALAELSDADSFAADTLARIRKDLGTDLVVLGSYFAVPGGQFRLDLRLQDAATGEVLASVGGDSAPAQTFTSLVDFNGAVAPTRGLRL
jgi:dihydrofolate reductase